jgi:hypothetical protein
MYFGKKESTVHFTPSGLVGGSFNMPAISSDKATLCLDYLDQTFCVFRIFYGGEVNVLYKRSRGRLGHIKPE